MRLADLVKTATEEGREKHVPVIELVSCPESGEDAVKITVGKEVQHPNTVEHHIKWVMLFGVTNGRAIHVVTYDIGPTYGEPKVVSHANLDQFSELIAVAYCNLHGLWESSLKL